MLSCSIVLRFFDEIGEEDPAGGVDMEMDEKYNAAGRQAEEHSVELTTLKKKIKVLERSFAASAGAYYSINLTRNIVPGVMYQVIDDKEYSINEQIGMPENARFSDVVAYWGNKLDEAQRKAYFDFFDIQRLMDCFRNGNSHVFFQYWTKTALFQPMLAEQHIVMYSDEENGDVLAISYVLDLTEKYHKEQYTEQLQESLQETQKAREYDKLQAALKAVDEILNNLSYLDSINSEAEFDQVLPQILSAMGRYASADRAYLFLPAASEQDVLRMTHEWCADGVRPTKDEMQNLRLCDMPNWTPRLKRGESIISSDWAKAKETAPEEYALFDGQDIRSLMVIPVFAKKVFVGYIGFDNPEQSKSALSVSMLKSAGGHIGGIRENLRLMEELEQKQRTLENSLNELKRANIAKTDFLRRMSHDIRTPINGIRGVISIANHYPEDAQKQKECREKIRQASGFLLDLVNSVLDMNKLESGTVHLAHEPFDLEKILQETCSIIEMQGQEYALSLEKGPWNIRHRHLLGSPLHLRQILQNVAGNAVKYNRAGGRILVGCDERQSDGTRATFFFTCTDNGHGMSEKFLKRAFEPFAQEADDARTSFTGTGLGLAITRQLVDLMGGEVKIESRLGVGTTVSMLIPFDIDTEYGKRQVPDEPLPEISLSGVRVLLVEDNDLNMEIAKFFLEKAGMTVTCAWNGQEAVEHFMASGEGDYDVILMDVMMPVLDGLDAAKKIRAAKRTDAKEIPIFAMTANAFPEDVEMSRAAGMNEHLSKPLQETEVLRTIQKYVQRRN